MATARYEVIPRGILRWVVTLQRAQQMKCAGRNCVPGVRLIDIHHISAIHTNAAVRAQVNGRIVGRDPMQAVDFDLNG